MIPRHRVGIFLCLCTSTLFASGPKSNGNREAKAPAADIASRLVPPGVPVQVKLPPPPAIRYVPGMDEPLVATGPVTEWENRDLDTALKAFHDAPAEAGPEGDFEDY